MHSASVIWRAKVRWISNGRPDPLPEVTECSNNSWKYIIFILYAACFETILKACLKHFYNLWESSKTCVLYTYKILFKFMEYKFVIYCTLKNIILQLQYATFWLTNNVTKILHAKRQYLKLLIKLQMQQNTFFNIIA